MSKEIIEEQYNNRKMIAKFDGSMLIRDYHTSWNELIPVVKKIQRLEIPDYNKKKPVISALMDLDIDILFNAVSHFVKWYNQPVMCNTMVADALPPMEVVVEALVRFSKGTRKELILIRRIPAKDNSRGWNWSSHDIKTTLNGEVIWWRFR